MFFATKLIMTPGALLCAPTLLAQQYTISAVAGGGAPPSSVGALTVRLPISGGIAMGNSGDAYFSAGNAVMKARVAGTGQ